MAMRESAALGAQRFLRDMAAGHLASLAAACSHVTIPAGQRMFDEGQTASRFWLIDAGQVTLDVFVPGDGRVVIETLGRGDLLGLSWLQPPYQWQFGAVATQRTEAFEFDAPAVRAACDKDPSLGYEVSRRLSAVIARRLQATRARLIESTARARLTG